MEQLSTYTMRTDTAKHITPRMNHGAASPTASSAMPTAYNAEEPKSLRTMAAARQKEMKVSITELATTIRTRLEDPGGIACEPADIREDSSQRWFARSCLPNDESTLAVGERQRRPTRTFAKLTRCAESPRKPGCSQSFRAFFRS